jgi:hypothetical protein
MRSGGPVAARAVLQASPFRPHVEHARIRVSTSLKAMRKKSSAAVPNGQSFGHCTQQENNMPVTRISIREGKTPEYKQALMDEIDAGDARDRRHQGG